MQNFSCCLEFKRIAFKTILLPSVQTDAALLASNSQRCWMLHVVSICTHCYMLLRVVGSCCAKFKTSQTYANGHNLLAQQCLDFVLSSGT